MDTNLLVRFITEDHDEQVDRVQHFLEQRTVHSPAYVSLLVLCEVAWTLSRVYRLSRSEVASAVSKILSLPALEIEQGELAMKAVKTYLATRADFGDCCIAALAAAAGCEYTLTFDKAAAKLPGMRLMSNA